VPASTRRILLVESDESLRRLVHYVLARAGMDADLAADAPEAIRALAAEKYQIVVIDLAQHDGSPHDVVHALSLIAPATRPVVIATGDPTMDTRLDAEVISLVVRKPYDVQALAEIVRSTLTMELAGDPAAADEGVRL
jgi:DNA-binding NtrC family response regulator